MATFDVFGFHYIKPPFLTEKQIDMFKQTERPKTKVIIYTSDKSMSYYDMRVHVMKHYTDNKESVFTCKYTEFPERSVHPDNVESIFEDLLMEAPNHTHHILTWSENLILLARLLHVRGFIDLQTIHVFSKEDDDEIYQLDVTVDEKGVLSDWEQDLFTGKFNILCKLKKLSNAK